MKREFVKAEVKVIKFDMEDVILTSIFFDGKHFPDMPGYSTVKDSRYSTTGYFYVNDSTNNVKDTHFKWYNLLVGGGDLNFSGCEATPSTQPN